VIHKVKIAVTANFKRFGYHCYFRF